MSQSVVAKRYAKAFFEIASAHKLFAEFESDLSLVSEMLVSNPQLDALLQAPTMSIENKKKLLSESFPHLQVMTKNLLFLLIDRHRFELVREIYTQFHRLSLEAQGQVEAMVTSAFMLSDEDELQLIDVFQKMTGKVIRLKSRIDPDLLGGVVVQMGDRLYDGSLRTQLRRFQELLKNSQVG